MPAQSSTLKRGFVNVSKSRIQKLEARVRTAPKRLQNAVSKKGRKQLLAGAAAAALVAYMAKSGKSLPTIKGVDANVLWGAGLYLAGTYYLRGDNGLMAKGAAAPFLFSALASGIQRGGMSAAPVAGVGFYGDEGYQDLGEI